MRKIIRLLLVVWIGVSVVFQKTAHAESPEMILQLEQQIQTIVTELNASRYALVENGHAIDQLKEIIAKNNSEYDNLSVVIVSRLEQAKQRLVELQVNNEQNNIIHLLLTSHNLVDFFQRLFLIAQLQEAANEKIVIAKQSQLRLEQLRQENAIKLDELTQRQTELTQQSERIETKRIELEQLLEENKEIVAQIIAKQEQDRLQAQGNSQQVVSNGDESAQQSASQATAQTTQTQQDQSSTTQQTQTTQANTSSGSVETPMLMTLSEFKVRGVVYHNNIKFTYYSELVLPGGGLNIPGRHVNANGYVADGDGYIVLANDSPLGTVIDTPFGAKGKVYDRGTFGNHVDVYIR